MSSSWALWGIILHKIDWYNLLWNVFFRIFFWKYRKNTNIKMHQTKLNDFGQQQNAILQIFWIENMASKNQSIVNEKNQKYEVHMPLRLRAILKGKNKNSNWIFYYFYEQIYRQSLFPIKVGIWIKSNFLLSEIPPNVFNSVHSRHLEREQWWNNFAAVFPLHLHKI